MKYFLRKLYLMKYMYFKVKDDKYRKKEIHDAIKYILYHPYLLFVHKEIDTNHDSTMKNVNAIVNMPYREELYQK